MIRRLALSMIGIVMLAAPVLASADQRSDLIVQLQAQVQQLLAQIARLSNGQSISTASCVDLSENLSTDDVDESSNGEVTKLQQFLAQDAAIYPEGKITGYFGPATMHAVQRWQASHGLVSSGDPDSTGYGFVGTKTRAAMRCAATASNTTSTTATATTVSTNNQAATQTSNSVNGMTNPVTISSFTVSTTTIVLGGSISFDWSSNLTQNDISYYGGGCWQLT